MKDFRFLFSFTALLEAWERRLQLELVHIEQQETAFTAATANSHEGLEPF